MRASLARLQRPVHAASLVAFRVAFGAVMVWEAWRYASKGWIERYYVDPVFHFSYPGFGWIAPLPLGDMYAVFAVLAIGGVGVALGWEYRITASTLSATTAYVFLLAPGHYLNHVYLLVLLAGHGAAGRRLVARPTCADHLGRVNGATRERR